MNTLDLLVIGAGLSGLTAAHTAAKAGLKVQVIAKGLGALHWSGGTIDVFGYAPEEHDHPVRRPFEAIETLAAAEPEHPLVLLGRERLATAIDGFLALSREIGLPYVGAATAGDNLLLPSLAGAARPTYLAPQAQIAGDLSRPEPMLIVGFEKMRDFYPELIAENLRKQGFQARAAFLPFNLLTDRRDSNTIQLAEGLDDPARRGRLATAIKKLARPGERVGLPALLGMADPMTAWKDMETQVGLPVFEIPTLPPSAPGMRLFKALRANLYRLGVRVDPNMEAIGANAIPAQNGTAAQIQWVESKTSARPLKTLAKAFLLATGGIMGGGFNSDHLGRVWEVVFDLPLTVPQQRSEWFRPAFLDARGHPVFDGGVRVNRSFQPVDAAGKLFYGNLWAAGDLLANDNPILQRSTEGSAIATGFAAARAIVGG
jgi:glycerol-3-phosphate dehydrogenase subunit B